MRRRTMMACESEGETISPSGVSEIRRSLDTPAIRASVMKRFVLPLVLGIGVIGSAGYFGVYAYYRLINPDAVIDRVHIRDGGPFHGAIIAESSCGESIVTRLSVWTGRNVADIANNAYEPLAALDQAITGRSILFSSAIYHPLKIPAGTVNASHTIEIDPSVLPPVE